jgi:hypothetical protein
MALTIQTPHGPETQPPSSPEQPERPERRSAVTAWVLVLAALVAAIALAVAALTGGDSGDNEPIRDSPPVQETGGAPTPAPVPAAVVQSSHYLHCMRSSGLSASDRLEQAAPHCWAFAEQVERCIAASAVTPDAIERWVDSCRARTSAERA